MRRKKDWFPVHFINTDYLAWFLNGEDSISRVQRLAKVRLVEKQLTLILSTYDSKPKQELGLLVMIRKQCFRGLSFCQ